MNISSHRDHVLKLFIENRNTILAYILASVRNHDSAEEIFQEVAVAVCESALQFQPGTNFRAWAREIARRRILAFWRTRGSDVRILTEEQLTEMANGFDQADRESPPDERLNALRKCVQTLKPFAKRLMELKYKQQMNLETISQTVGKNPESVRKALYRGRLVIRECVERRLAITEVGE